MTREADNSMTGSDFDWMVSNHAVWGWKAPLKESVSGVSLLQLSPFSLPSFPFSPETSDTQAISYLALKLGYINKHTHIYTKWS